MVIRQGEIWWVDLGDPVGSAPGYRRPAVILQSDRFNSSRIGTFVCLPLTSNMRLANTPGTTLIAARGSGLDVDSVANAAHVMTIDQSLLIEPAGSVTPQQLRAIFAALDLVLGR